MISVIQSRYRCTGLYTKRESVEPWHALLFRRHTEKRLQQTKQVFFAHSATLHMMKLVPSGTPPHSVFLKDAINFYPVR